MERRQSLRSRTGTGTAVLHSSTNVDISHPPTRDVSSCDGHPFDGLRAGSHTPGEGAAPLHYPFLPVCRCSPTSFTATLWNGALRPVAATTIRETGLGRGPDVLHVELQLRPVAPVIHTHGVDEVHEVAGSDVPVSLAEGDRGPCAPAVGDPHFQVSVPLPYPAGIGYSGVPGEEHRGGILLAEGRERLNEAEVVLVKQRRGYLAVDVNRRLQSRGI